MTFKDLAERLGIDEDDFQELVDLFVTTSLSDIDKIKKGVLDGSSQDAAAASHSIKGASGNLGFDDIFDLAKEMEHKARQGHLDGFDDDICCLENMVTALTRI